jgi:hypothetical protein
MRKILFGLFSLLYQLSFSQDQVVVSLFTEFEGQIVKLHSDTIEASIYYNITGNESISDVVLNVITVRNDGTKSSKEFEVTYYSKNEEDNTVEVNVNSPNGPILYIFLMENYILVTKTENGSFMWSGDIHF